MDDLDRFLKEQLKDPEFAEEWERSKAENKIMKLPVEARFEMSMIDNDKAT